MIPADSRGATSFPLSFTNPDAASLVITASSENAILDWSTFATDPGETVQLQLPTADSAVLIRSLANEPTLFDGTLISNGRVYLIATGGLDLGANSLLTAGGLTASTLNMANGDFLAGNYLLQQVGAGSQLSAQGALAAASGGEVALFGAGLQISGGIQAPQGFIGLGALSEAQLSGAGVPERGFTGTTDGANTIALDGTLDAADGTVIMVADSINLTGNVDLGAGSLTVGNTGNDASISGDVSVVLTGGGNGAITLNGGELVLNGGSLTGGGSAGEITIDGGITLTTVPLPPALWLLAAASGLLLRLARR